MDVLLNRSQNRKPFSYVKLRALHQVASSYQLEFEAGLTRAEDDSAVAQDTVQLLGVYAVVLDRIHYSVDAMKVHLRQWDVIFQGLRDVEEMSRHMEGRIYSFYKRREKQEPWHTKLMNMFSIDPPTPHYHRRLMEYNQMLLDQINQIKVVLCESQLNNVLRDISADLFKLKSISTLHVTLVSFDEQASSISLEFCQSREVFHDYILHKVDRLYNIFVEKNLYHVTLYDLNGDVRDPWESEIKPGDTLRLSVVVYDVLPDILPRCPNCRRSAHDFDEDASASQFLTCPFCDIVYEVEIAPSSDKIPQDVQSTFAAMTLDDRKRMFKLSRFLTRFFVHASPAPATPFDDVDAVPDTGIKPQGLVFHRPTQHSESKLPADERQRRVDTLHELLLSSPTTGDRVKLLQELRDMCNTYNRLPQKLFLKNVQEDRFTRGALSYGSFASVYKGIYEGQPVALKVLHLETRDTVETRAQKKKRLCREVLIWVHSSKHRCILPILGVDDSCFPQYGTCMVLPWMANGSIYERIAKWEKGQQLGVGTPNRKQVDQWLYEVAQGLEYIHDGGIVHGDLRAANVLLDEQYGARVADFGLAVIAEVDYLSTLQRNPHWASPELLTSDVEESGRTMPTKASDVYSFGSVCVELYTGKAPYAGLALFPMMDKICKGVKPEHPAFYEMEQMSEHLWSLVLRMLSTAVEERPTAKDIVITLCSLLNC